MRKAGPQINIDPIRSLLKTVHRCVCVSRSEILGGPDGSGFDKSQKVILLATAL
ncbi:unnamed protein product [Ixodes persulcatus]